MLGFFKAGLLNETTAEFGGDVGMQCGRVSGSCAFGDNAAVRSFLIISDVDYQSIIFRLISSFAIRSSRFMDAYLKGLDGRQAAWAIKRYCGHRVLPASILEEFDATHSLSSTN